MQMLCGGVALVVAGLLAGELGDVQAPSWRSVLAVAYLIVFGSLLAFSAYAWLLRKAITHHRLTMLVSAGLLVATVYCFRAIPMGFISSQDIGQLNGQTEMGQCLLG